MQRSGPNDNANSSFGFLGVLVREGTALVFAGLVWLVVWGGYAPTLDTAEQAFRAALVTGVLAIGYVGIQALAVVTQPLGRETRYLLDLLLSLVPLAFVGYAVAQALAGQLSLTYFQRGALLLAGLACVVDVVIFTWFNMKLNKLASDFVSMR